LKLVWSREYTQFTSNLRVLRTAAHKSQRLASITIKMAISELTASSTIREDEYSHQSSSCERPSMVHAIAFLEPLVGQCGNPMIGINFGLRNGFLAIADIAESSPFRHSALQAGDRVLQINGARCNPFDEMQAREYTVEWATEQICRTNALASISVIPEGNHSDLVSITLVNTRYTKERYEFHDHSWMGVELQQNEGETQLTIGAVHINSPLSLYANLWTGDQCLLINGESCQKWTPSKAVQVLQNPPKPKATIGENDVDRFVTLHTVPSGANLNYIKQQYPWATSTASYSTTRTTSRNRGGGLLGCLLGCVQCLATLGN
jgi:predicted metalloprotease with PDZ domain